MSAIVSPTPDYVTTQAVTESLYVTLHGLFTEPFRVTLGHYCENKDHWLCMVKFHNDNFPFRKATRTIDIAQVVVERGDLVVKSMVERVPANKVPRSHCPPHELRWSMEDPECFTTAVNEVFEIALDFCRVHYKRTVKDKHRPNREAIKVVLRELSETIRKRRKEWRG